MKHNDLKNGYKGWSKKLVIFSTVFITVLVIWMIVLTVGIKVIDTTKILFLVSIPACIIWCLIGYFVLKHMVIIEEAMRAQAFSSNRPDITNPLYKQIFDMYQYNCLEEFTQNIFFHTWKLQDFDDHNNMIDLIFTKKDHEISIEFSDKEISIIIDEETDSPTEILLNMTDFDTMDDVFNSITSKCRNAIQKNRS